MSTENFKMIILCSWGATSSQLAKNVQEAANKRGMNIQADAGGTGEFKQQAGEYDVALLEPQVRHLMREVKAVADEYNIPVDLVDQRAFALMDGDQVLDQALKLLEGE